MRLTVLAVLTGIAILCAAGSLHAQQSAVTLHVSLQGGEFERVQAKYAGDRFTAATGIKIEWTAGNLTDFLDRMVAAKGRTPPFDVVYLDDKIQPQAIEAGTLSKIDPAIVTNLSKLYGQARSNDGYGPAMLFWAWGLFYNVDAFRKAGIPEPTSWLDLWNPKLAGHVGIFDIGAAGGVDFVLKMAEIGGGGPDNLRPGLDKIATLKPYAFFASTNAATATMQAGDVWVVPFNNGRSWGMIDAGFPGRFVIPKEGGYSHTTTIDVVAGTQHPKEAQLYINYVLDPVAQVGQAFDIPYAPVLQPLAALMDAYPNVARKFPTPGGEMMRHLASADWDKVFAQYPDLVDSWNRTVKTH